MAGSWRDRGERGEGGTMGERTTSADAPLRAMVSENLCSEHFLKTCDGEGGQSGREGLVSESA